MTMPGNTLPEIRNYRDLWRISFLVFKKRLFILLSLSLLQAVLLSLFFYSVTAITLASAGFYPNLYSNLKSSGIFNPHNVFFGINFIAAMIVIAALFALISLFYGMFASLLKDDKKSVKNAYKESLTKIKHLLISSLLMSLIIGAGLLLLIVPGVIFAVRYMFAPLVVITENKNWREALDRSKELASGYNKKIFYNILVFFIPAVVISIIIDSLPYNAILNYAADIVINAFWFCYIFYLYVWLKQKKNESIDFVKDGAFDISAIKKSLVIGSLLVVIVPLVLLPVSYIFAKKSGFVETRKIEHAVSMDRLVTKIPNEEGNGADEFMQLIEKIRNIEVEGNIVLDEEMMRLLKAVAAKKTFDLYPKYSSRPNSFDELIKKEVFLVNPAALFNISEQIIEDSKKKIEEGDRETAIKNLEIILILGRNLEQTKESEVVILVGIGMQKLASEALMDSYIKIGIKEKADLFNDYNEEIKIMGELYKKKTMDMVDPRITLFSLLNPYSYKGVMMAKEVVLRDEEDLWKYNAMSVLGHYYLIGYSPINHIKFMVVKDAIERVSRNEENDNIRAIAKDILDNYALNKLKMGEFYKDE